MQIELSTKLVKSVIALAIPLAAGAYFLSGTPKTGTKTSVLPENSRVVRVDTPENTQTNPRENRRPIGKPGTRAVRPQPTDGIRHAGPRDRPGKRIPKPKKVIPAA